MKHKQPKYKSNKLEIRLEGEALVVEHDRGSFLASQVSKEQLKNQRLYGLAPGIAERLGLEVEAVKVKLDEFRASLLG